MLINSNPSPGTQLRHVEPASPPIDALLMALLELAESAERNQEGRNRDLRLDGAADDD